MTEEYANFKHSVEGDGDNWLSLLRTLNRDEIFEVLSQGFCQNCQALFETRLRRFINEKRSEGHLSNNRMEEPQNRSVDMSNVWSANKIRNKKLESNPQKLIETIQSISLTRQSENSSNSLPSSVNSELNSLQRLGSEIILNDGLGGVSSPFDDGISDEQKEYIRFSKVGRKKDFVHMEKVSGRSANVLQGLELHTKVFNVEEQKKIVEYVYSLQRMGQKGELRDRTYSEPRKWMRGKGRITMQFGCCYNYSEDKSGNPPGIIRDEDVDPLPTLFKQMIKRMVRWHILPSTCIPNSCIVNIYDEGDCIPPHIDHHDFLRPFCTVSFLTECNILFGSNLKIAGPGEFTGPVSIPLPLGSVLILNGNGADIAKHCIPGVPAKRISITFRRMDNSKLPYNFRLDPELANIKPLGPLRHVTNKSDKTVIGEDNTVKPRSNDAFLVEKDDFPPLGASNSSYNLKVNKYVKK